MVFRECLEALIVCTGNEEIVLLHGRDNTIWHAFFGMAGANNDINVLDISPLFDDLINDTALVLPYEVNGVGGQEGARKDVGRAFSVLQGRWGIIQQPTRAYEVNTIRRIMYSCIIMHNMILKDQKMRVFDWNDNYANPSRNIQRTWVERNWSGSLEQVAGTDCWS
ncbi:ALP1-like protein isoform X1 [Tanacetum coccineum]